MLKISLVVFLMLLSGVVMAQDDLTISVGDTVTGEITDAEFEIPYIFEAEAGTVIVAELRRGDIDSGLYNGDLLLLSVEGDELANSTAYYGFEGASAIIVAELPDDGEYTLLATREGGRGGEETGAFALTLIEAEELTVGETIEAELSESGRDQYFVVRSEEGFFNLLYRNLGGNYLPLVTVSSITEEGTPETVVSLSGRVVESTLSVADEGETLHLVSVLADDLDYFFSEFEVSFEIGLVAP